MPEGALQWSKKLAHVDETNILHFADGSSQREFDLIVGADGAWSTVRSLVSDAKPHYSGIAGHALHASRLHMVLCVQAYLVEYLR